jgi:hypothetical protein
MQRKDQWTLVGVAAVTAIISFIIANALFNSPTKHSLKTSTVEAISGTLPDVKNDSNYNSFINNNDLDPTQPVQIGNSQNSTPFR